MSTLALRARRAALPPEVPLAWTGRVVALRGGSIRALLSGAGQGELVEVRRPGCEPLLAEVSGFRGDEVVLSPLGPTEGLRPGAEVVAGGRCFEVQVGEALLGRVLDGLGRPLDGQPLPPGLVAWPVARPPPSPLSRAPIREPLQLGLRALDGLLTAGRGQRLGVFAGSGVGKSTLLGQLVRGCGAAVVVVALIGERGREVRELVDGALGAVGLRRSVVVAATSDEPAAVRIKGAEAATAIAEWFADERGLDVLLVLDSVTRFARALREVGLASGEPPTRQGYPPSAFARLPRLLERAGPRAKGSITAVYAVLVAGGDLDEPVADEVRGLLDGHVVLDRELAGRGHFPAIDVLRSVSRVMPSVAGARHQEAAARLRRVLGAWERQRDLVAMGAYASGSDPDVDLALRRIDRLEAFLRQAEGEPSTLAEAVAALEELVA